MGHRILFTYKKTPDLLPCYDYYQGGIVVYLDGNGGGLLAAPDILGEMMWDSDGGGAFMPKDDYGAYGLGASNTQRIIDTIGSSRAIAAQACLDYSNEGYNDWFLPSVAEACCLTNYNKLYNDGMWDCLYSNWYNPAEPTNYELWTSCDVDTRAIVVYVKTGSSCSENLRFKTYSPRMIVPCRYIT